jgi:hypothetical protein
MSLCGMGGSDDARLGRKGDDLHGSSKGAAVTTRHSSESRGSKECLQAREWTFASNNNAI